MDIIDLKDTESSLLLRDHGIMSQNALNASKNIYLLSERGLANLCLMLGDSTAWDMFVIMRDDYFNVVDVRGSINNIELITEPKPEVKQQQQPEPQPTSGMNQLQQVFNYGNTNVRVVMIDNEPWFVAKDLADVLEIQNVRQVLGKLDSDEKDVYNVYTLGGEQQMTVVNEAGMYSLVLTSRKPEAKQFKRWITHEVLPSIRKTGSYNAIQAPQQPALPKTYAEALLEAGRLALELEKKEEEKRLIEGFTILKRISNL